MTRLCIVLLAFAGFFVAACDGGDDQPGGTPAASAEASTGATSEATLTAGLPEGTRAWTFEPAISLPEDLALTIGTGCWQCDGPTNSIVRLRRTPSGLEERTIFPEQPEGQAIAGSAFDTQGRAAVSVCGPNYCGGGLMVPAADAQTTVSVSQDGAVRLVAGNLLPGARTVAGITWGEAAVSGPFIEGQPNALSTYPSGVTIARPARGLEPMVLPDAVLWIDEGRRAVIDDSGAELWSAPDGWSIASGSAVNADASRVALNLYTEDGTARNLVVIVERGQGTLRELRSYIGEFTMTGAPLDECRTVGNAQVNDLITPIAEGQPAQTGFYPAIIDVCEGKITPINDPFMREPYFNGRNYVLATQAGPFLEVAPQVGDCLNVRSDPSPNAAVVGCFVEGVLLRDANESRPGDGQVLGTWRRVVTPSGETGWASDEYLTP